MSHQADIIRRLRNENQKLRKALEDCSRRISGDIDDEYQEKIRRLRKELERCRADRPIPLRVEDQLWMLA